MENTEMKRGLKNRHLQMIALGGAIGTGPFYGSASTIALAGPAVMLSYLIGGIVIFLIMRMLGEMAVDEPVSGSFSHYATKYWGASRDSSRAGIIGSITCLSRWRSSRLSAST